MFQSENQWDVDTAAQVLNKSLFGVSKKHKSPAVLSPAPGQSTQNSNTLPDSDDEQYSKKDKKRLKRKRQKNQLNTKSQSEDSLQVPDHDNPVKKKNADNSRINSGQLISKLPGHKIDKVKSLPKAQVSPKVKRIKLEGLKHSEPRSNEKLSKKRKRSTEVDDAVITGQSKKAKIRDSIENKQAKNAKLGNGDVSSQNKKSEKENFNPKKIEVVSKGKKKHKIEEDLVNSENSTPVEGKKKRRNRKKKNNSKKNKYKHLALNNKNKTEVTEAGQNNESADLESEIKTLFQKSEELSVSKTNEFTAVVKVQNGSVKKAKQLNLTGDKSLHDTKNMKTKKKYRQSNDVSETLESQIKVDSTSVTHSNNSQVKSLKDLHSQSVKEKSGSVNVKSPGNMKVKKEMLQKMLNKQNITHQEDTIDEKKKKKKKNQKLKKGTLENSDASNNGHAKFSDVETVPKQPSTDTEMKAPAAPQESSVSASIWGKGTQIGQQAKEKLNSARFRYLNEQLYTCQGSEALQLFKEDKEAFQVYHEGFQSQTSKWPINPLDVFIKQIKDRPKNLIIADFGCGDARLAQNLPQKVHSFDLVALNNRVTVCDMSQTQLPSEHVDIAVFCLSLMGTNMADYILEANRVLKTGGLMKVAEIVSRFSGLSRFTDAVCSCGFQLLNKRELGTMFYLLDFKKIKSVKRSASAPGIKLKPCVYKKR